MKRVEYLNVSPSSFKTKLLNSSVHSQDSRKRCVSVRKQGVSFFIIGVLIILLLSSLSVAEVSAVTVHTVKNQINPTEQAVFQIEIKNTADAQQRYSIFSFAQGWNVDPSTLKDK